MLLAGASRIAAQPIWHVHSETVVVEDSAAREQSGIVSVASTRDALIERSGSSLLSDAVFSLHPSLAIRSYGSQGSIAFASFRGLPAEYVSVNFGGFRLANAQNSLADLGLLDASILSDVTLLSNTSSGNSSAEAGNLSLGLAPVALLGDASVLTLGSEVGSYSNKVAAAEAKGYLRFATPLSRSVSLSVGALLSSSIGNYPFTQDSGRVTVLRSNNDSHLSNGTVNLGFTPSDNLRLSITSLYLRSDRGSPGGDTRDSVGASNPFERLFDERYLVGLLLSHKTSDDFAYNVRFSYQSQFESFVDSIGLPRLNDRYTNRLFSGGFDAVSYSASWVDLLTAVSVDHALLISNENSVPGGGDITRDVYRGSVGARVFDGPLIISGFLRTEKYSEDDKPAVLPQLSVRFGQDIGLLGYGFGASYSALYHPPTLNELYWTVGGNPDLLPEHGHAFELVADGHIASLITLKLAGFYNTLQDQIIWRPVSGQIWSPFNVESSRSLGLEASLGMTVEPSSAIKFLGSFSITMQSAEDRTEGSVSFGHELPYSTPLSWTYSIGSVLRDYGDITISGSYRGHRYPNLGNTEDTKLPPVALMNITLRSNELMIADAIGLRPSLAIINLFDKQYDEIISYPMPGRQFKFGIELTHSHPIKYE